MSLPEPDFEVRRSATSLRFVFSSTMGNIDDICAQTTTWLKSKIDSIGKELFSINLVIREGLTNAVRHGNKNDPEKKAVFSITLVSKKSIRLVIEDEGDGFDWRKEQDKDLFEDEDHGRGISIMGTYFSRYSYNDKGNILTIEKDLFC